MTTGKIIGFTVWTFVSKVISLLFRFVIAFLPRHNCLLISWLQSPFTVILELKKIKSVTVYIVSPSICHEVMGLKAVILVFWMLSFKPTFSFSSYTFFKRLFSSSSLSAMSGVIWISEVIGISPSYLDSSLCFSSPVFLMMYYAYKLNKQGDSLQPWCTHFPIWNQSVVPCPGLTVASWSAYRFLKTLARWSGIPISFKIFHSLLWSTQSKALAYSIRQK